MQTATAPDQQSKDEKSSACGVSRADTMNAPVTVHVSVGNSKRDFAPLYWIRTERGLSIRDLAVLAGVTPWQIQGYEACVSEPRISNAFRLARALGVSVDLLFGIPYKQMARDDR